MPEHVHIWIWVSSSARPGVLIQRCPCGALGPMNPVPVR